MLRFHRTERDMAQPSVVAFSHHRVQRAEGNPVLSAAVQGVFHQCVGYQPHIQGVGQCNGCFQCAQLLNLHESGGFAEAVVYITGGGELVGEQIVLGGKNDGNAGVNVVLMQGGMTDGNA